MGSFEERASADLMKIEPIYGILEVFISREHTILAAKFDD